MDVTQPEERLRTIFEQTGSRHILAGSSTAALAFRIAGVAPFVVSEATLAEADSNPILDDKTIALPSVQPNALLYVVFTSGSTGQPKGVRITHANFASQVKHVRDFLRFRPTSRVADFASYAFDVSWANVINALTAGGCLCVPSEHERKNDMVGFVERCKVNYLDLTPSVAALLDWSRMPRLDTIVLGGELVELDRIPFYHAPEAVIVTYGPAEASCTTHAINVKTEQPHPATIGHGLGVSSWVIDSDTDTLLPIGVTGELVIEGPLVSPGYLGDPTRTAASFIQDPSWLLQGAPGVPGRHGTVYRTGDLVRYEVDGTLTFVGRKDTQVKVCRT